MAEDNTTQTTQSAQTAEPTPTGEDQGRQGSQATPQEPTQSAQTTSQDNMPAPTNIKNSDDPEIEEESFPEELLGEFPEDLGGDKAVGKTVELTDPATATSKEGEPTPDPTQQAAAEDQQTAPAVKDPEKGDASKQTTEGSSTPPQDGPKSAETILQELGLLPTGITPGGITQVTKPQVTQPGVTQPQDQQLQIQQQGVAQPQVQQPGVTQPVVPQAQQPSYEDVIKQQVDTLASQHYKLDEKTVEVLQAEGNETLIDLAPQLAARVFVDAVQATIQQVAQMLPAMMQQNNQQVEREQKHAEAFYTFWDERGFDLREYDTDLQQIGNAYLTANPATTLQDGIAKIGAHLIVAKELKPNKQVKAVTNGSGGNATAGGTQAANGVQAGQAAFQSAGSTQPGNPHQASQSPFEEFFDAIESAEFDS